MEKRKQFTMYESIYKALTRIRDPEERVKAYDSICAYALYGQEPDLESMSDTVAIAFELLRPVLDAAKRKAESAKLGGSKPKANRKQTESKSQANRKQTEREKERENETEKEIEIEKEIETERERERETEEKAEPAGRPRARCEEKEFSLFWEDYPNKRDPDFAWQVWKKLDPDRETVRRIREGLAAWKDSGQWLEDDGRFIPTASRWLEKRRWEERPASGKKQIPTGASGRLGQAELEAIQRVLREGE